MNWINSLRFLPLAILLCVGGATHAGEWNEPKRGSELRSTLLATIRPLVAFDLSPPIEFVVYDLRQDGDVAFGSFKPQRPGGGQIPWASTRLAARGNTLDQFDGFTVHAFFRRIEGRWYVEDYSIGATDVWWYGSPLCDAYRSVISDYC